MSALDSLGSLGHSTRRALEVVAAEVAGPRLAGGATVPSGLLALGGLDIAECRA